MDQKVLQSFGTSEGCENIIRVYGLEKIGVQRGAIPRYAFGILAGAKVHSVCGCLHAGGCFRLG